MDEMSQINSTQETPRTIHIVPAEYVGGRVGGIYHNTTITLLRTPPDSQLESRAETGL